VQTAVARRELGALWEMGTMCAVPEGVRWVSFGSELGFVVGVLADFKVEGLRDFIRIVWVEKGRETEGKGKWMERVLLVVYWRRIVGLHCAESIWDGIPSHEGVVGVLRGRDWDWFEGFAFPVGLLVFEMGSEGRLQQREPKNTNHLISSMQSQMEYVEQQKRI